MTNLTLKLLRSRGIITGSVLPFSRHSIAMAHAERNPGKVIVKVDELTNINGGKYWAMTAEDGQRMQAAGYEEDDVSKARRAKPVKPS